MPGVACSRPLRAPNRRWNMFYLCTVWYLSHDPRWRVSLDQTPFSQHFPVRTLWHYFNNVLKQLGPRCSQDLLWVSRGDGSRNGLYKFPITPLIRSCSQAGRDPSAPLRMNRRTVPSLSTSPPIPVAQSEGFAVSFRRKWSVWFRAAFQGLYCFLKNMFTKLWTPL